MCPVGKAFPLDMKARKNKKHGQSDAFDPQVFLDTAGVARNVAEFRKGEAIYSQGEAADSVMYLQKGGVKFSVVNGSGKEAVVAMFGPNDLNNFIIQIASNFNFKTVCRRKSKRLG